MLFNNHVLWVNFSNKFFVLKIHFNSVIKRHRLCDKLDNLVIMKHVHLKRESSIKPQRLS